MNHYREIMELVGNVLILGLIVIIRTFLSMALQLEVDGRWPWQHAVENLEPRGDPSRISGHNEP